MRSKQSPSEVSCDLECLCQLMSTCGKKLDHERAKSLTDQYFERMRYLQNKKVAQLPPRIRFMLQDCMDLRANNWVPRHPQIDQGPRTLGQIRSELSEENPKLMFDPEFMRVNASPPSSTSSSSSRYGGAGRHQRFSNNDHHVVSNGYDLFGPTYQHQKHQQTNNTFDFFGSSHQQEQKTGQKNNSDHHHHHQRAAAKQQQNHKLTAEADVRRGSAAFRNNDASNNNNNFTRTSAYDPYPNWSNSNKLASSKKNETSTNTSVNVLNNNNSPRSARNTPDATASDGGRVAPAAAKPLNQVVASAVNNNKGAAQKQHQQQYRTNNGSSSAGSGLIKLGGVGGLWRRSPQTATTTATVSSSSPPVASTNSGTTSIDTFQPSYQHVIDNAQMRRKSPSTTPQQQRRQQQQQQQLNKTVKTNDDTNGKQQQQRARGGASNNTDARQPAVVESAAPSPSSFDQQVVYQQQQAPVVVESAELMEQIARQLLVAPIKTKEYQHHFDRLVKLSPTFIQHCCAKMIEKSLDPTNKDDKKVLKAAQVLKQITDKEMITLTSIHEIFKETIEKRSAIAADDNDDDDKLLSMLVSKLVHLDMTDLGKVFNALHPSDFSLVLQVLNNLTKLEGEAAVSGKYREANVSLLDMLPRLSDEHDSEAKQNLLGWLRDAQLDFLEPLLVMQVELPAQLEANLNSNNLYKWLREKVPIHLHGQPTFIQALLTCCLSHITDTAGKGEEKLLFRKLQGLLQKLLADDAQLQLCVLNTVQRHCCERAFPKGMMRRLFECLYNDDIVDEDVFLRWKEIDDGAVPGKEKALAQVISWLTWLQEADTEDEEDE